MKAGFYLRPDGEEIILVGYPLYKTFNINIREISMEFETNYILPDNVTKMFVGNWIYLGR